jgi:PAS domain S-box-containing protein
MTKAEWLSDEEWFRTAAASAGIGMWEWHIEEGLIRYSSVARQILGIDEDAPVPIDLVRNTGHPHDRAWTSDLSRRAQDPEERLEAAYKYRIIRHDTGEVRWVFAQGKVLFDRRDGKDVAAKYVGTIRDITDEELTARALIESEARLRVAVDVAEMAIWEVDQTTGTITPSPELNRIFNLPEDARPTVAQLRAFYAPGEEARIAAEAAEIRASGGTKFQTTIKYLLPGGVTKWILLRAIRSPLATETEEKVIGALMDVTQQRQQEERIRTVANELQHRMKNLLAIISSVAMQTFRSTKDPKQAQEAFLSRLRAIGAASNLILSKDRTATSLDCLLAIVLEPYRTDNPERIRIEGVKVEIPSKTAQAVSMAIHELATNAVKYGALSVPEGSVSVSWTQTEEGLLCLDWEETGGPPVCNVESRGFGSALLERGLFHAPDSVSREFRGSGVSCRIEIHPTKAAKQGGEV